MEKNTTGVDDRVYLNAYLNELVNHIHENKLFLWLVRLVLLSILVNMFVALAKLSEIFMQSIEHLISVDLIGNKRALNRRDSVMAAEHIRKSWQDLFANLLFRVLGSNCFELLFPFVDFVFNRSLTNTYLYVVIGIYAFDMFVINAFCLLTEKRVNLRVEKYKLYLNYHMFSIVALCWLYFSLFSFNRVESVQNLDVIKSSFNIILYLVYLAVSLYIYLCLTPVEESRLDDYVEAGWPMALSFNGPNASYFRNNFSSVVFRKVIKLIKKLDSHTTILSDDQKYKIIILYVNSLKKHSFLYYKIHSIKKLTGSSTGCYSINNYLKKILRSKEIDSDEARHANNINHNNVNNNNNSPKHELDFTLDEKPAFMAERAVHLVEHRKAVVEFSASIYVIDSKSKKCKIVLSRHENLDVNVVVILKTSNGTLKNYLDFKPLDNHIYTFDKNEKFKHIPIKLISNSPYKPGENFYIHVEVQKDSFAVCGPIRDCMIVTNDLEPSDELQEIEFMDVLYHVTNNDEFVYLSLIRKKYFFRSVNVCMKVYVNNVEIDFKNSVTLFDETQEIEFGKYEKEKHFKLKLTNLLKIARDKFMIKLCIHESESRHTKIGDRNMATVFIATHNVEKRYEILMKKIISDQLNNPKTSILDQFKNAINVNEGDIEHANLTDYILHVKSLPWKITFALIPPVDFLNGWFCFFVSFFLIVVFTFLMAVYTSIFPLFFGFKQTILTTVIIPIGLGIPKIFSSRLALRHRDVDNAIGNITFQNFTNILIGVGITWFIFGMAFLIKGENFEINASSLHLPIASLIVFNFALLLIFMLRRQLKMCAYSELGGSNLGRFFTSLVFFAFWCSFVYLAQVN